MHFSEDFIALPKVKVRCLKPKRVQINDFVTTLVSYAFRAFQQGSTIVHAAVRLINPEHGDIQGVPEELAREAGDQIPSAVPNR